MSDNIIKFHNNEFYTAIMDEDSERIEDMSKKYGSNFLIKIQDGAPGEVLWKDLAILPLHLAASYRRVKSMQSLLSAGADPEMRDRLGQTTLHLVITGWPSSLAAWPKPSSKVQTAVSGVCRRAEACLRLLCEHGVNVNAEVEGESHQTALHLSVRYAALSAIHILASYGADVNAVDSSGMTPLHMAAGILRKDIIASLIKEGADVNMEVKQSGNTPLHLIAVAMTMKTTKTLEDNTCCISELLEQGATANAVNKAGLTPLQEACSMGNKELVDVLLSYLLRSVLLWAWCSCQRSSPSVSAHTAASGCRASGGTVPANTNLVFYKLGHQPPPPNCTHTTKLITVPEWKGGAVSSGKVI